LVLPPVLSASSSFSATMLHYCHILLLMSSPAKVRPMGMFSSVACLNLQICF
ncbi:uncharacterized protein A4U43_C05F16150, partial [Asparagus officinalis]